MFDKLYTEPFFRTMGFTVKIQKEDGLISKDTKAIFNTSSFSSKNVEKFNNKKVLIGYNIKADQVIVIKVV